MRSLIAIMLVLALAGPALACSMTTSTPAFAIGAFYVPDNTGCASTSQVTIYKETNGVPGLQRQDECGDDTCGGFYEPDTIIF